MQGFLNVDKSAGWTSRDAVNVIVKLCPKGTKVGHAGTLDPLATGVLVVAVGRATRLIEYAQEGTKTYRGEFLLGRVSDTEDVEGEVEEIVDAPAITREALERVLPEFLGKLMQRPPAYSAIQVAGQRSYDRARRGEVVDLPARQVKIDAIKLTDFEYPRFELEVVCGKGTYIRSLGRDIGERLGSGAVMSQLRRLRVGAFGIEDAVSIDKLRAEGVAGFLRPAIDAIGDGMPRVELSRELLWRLLNGQVVALPCNEPEAAVIWEGRLISIARQVGDGSSVGSYRGAVNLETALEVFGER
jgi:tRNA pseudouridine55 synthase